MKRAKVLLLATLLGVGTLMPVPEAAAYDLPTVSIRCHRTTFSLCLGAVATICLNFYEITCSNGFHDWGRI